MGRHSEGQVSVAYELPLSWLRGYYVRAHSHLTIENQIKADNECEYLECNQVYKTWIQEIMNKLGGDCKTLFRIRDSTSIRGHLMDQVEDPGMMLAVVEWLVEEGSEGDKTVYTFGNSWDNVAQTVSKAKIAGSKILEAMGFDITAAPELSFCIKSSFDS